MKIGEKFNNDRYTVLRKLGWGHFSTVWLVYDHRTGGQAALKVCLCFIRLLVDSLQHHQSTQRRI